MDTVVGFTQGILYHEDGTLKEVRYANNVLTTYDYDQNRRLKDLAVTNNGEEILRQHYEFDLAGNITYINNRSYEYDANNQLIKAYTPEEFIEPEAKEHQIALYSGDQQSMAVFDFSVEQKAIIHLDYNSSSIGLDFGSGGAKVKKIQLVPNFQSQTHRIIANSIDLYTSNDNSTYKLVNRGNWEFEKDDQGIVTITAKEIIDTSYLKIHILFDDRDMLFNPVDKATFLNHLSRMVRVYQQASERTEEYQYDAAGNRKSMTLQLVDLLYYDYEYYENSDRLRSDGKYIYSYDKVGNLISKNKIVVDDGEEEVPEDRENWDYEYDLLNRLIRVRKNGKILSEYRYDPEGYRVVKKTTEQTIHYVFEGTEPIFEKNITTGQTKSYVYVLGKHLARVDGVISDPEAKVYFYHTDHIGSIKAVTNKASEVVWNADYLAFGTRFGETIGSDFEEWHGFTGKEFDPDTGLSYFNARWYDQEIGRFISEDPIKDGVNWYTYVNNNPLLFIDPSGLTAEVSQQLYKNWQENWLDTASSATQEEKALRQEIRDKDPSTYARNYDAFAQGQTDVFGSEYETVYKQSQQSKTMLDNAPDVLNWIEARTASGHEPTFEEINQAAMDIVKGKETLQSYVVPVAYGLIGWGQIKTNLPANKTSDALENVPEKYRTQVSRAFQGKIKAKTYPNDRIVYRHWGGKSAETGSPWYSPKKYIPSIARSKLSLPSGNTAENITAFKIPAGNTILEGKAASMVDEVGFGNYAIGGGEQIYLPNPNVAIPIK